MTESITTMQIIEVWLAVGLTLMMYSFLYKDNPLFKLGEYMYVGLSVGYGLCGIWFQTLWPKLVYPLYRVVAYNLGKSIPGPLEKNETLWLIIPLILGVLMLTRFSSKIGWLSRYTFAFITGTGAGIAIPYAVSAEIFKQMVPSLEPLWGKDVSLFQTINTLLILVGVLSVLIYFFFSVEHKGVIKRVARVGIFYMMIAFGASFGYTVMARESLAIGRITKLVEWAKPQYYWATIILFFAVAILVTFLEITKKKPNPSESAE
ncbi:MAG: hypothetical protein WC980_08210 [Candidatus Brocadiia bacterium]